MGSKLRRLSMLFKGNIGLMTLTSGLWNFAGQMVWPFSSLYYLALGATYFDLGLISALWGASRIIPIIIGGYLTDLFGRKRLVVLLSFILSFVNLSLAFIPSWEFLLPVMIIDGFVSGLREPAFGAIIADSTKPNYRALGYALWNFGPILFGIFSPYIAGKYIDEVGIISSMRTLFIIVFAFSFVACILRLLFLKETLVHHDEKVTITPRKMISGFKDLFHQVHQSFLILILIFALMGLINGLTGPFGVTYATKDVIRLTASQWGLISISQTTIKLMLVPIFAYASDRFGRVIFIASSLFLAGFSGILFVTSSNFELALISLTLNALSLGIISINLPALFADYIPRNLRGRAIALRGVTAQLASTLGSIVGGYLYQEISYASPFITASVIAFLASIVTFLTIREPKIREE